MTVDFSPFHQLDTPFAIIDKEYTYIEISKQWQQQFKLKKTFKGKKFFECLPELPEEFQIDVSYCLEGISSRSDTKRIVTSCGNAVWYQWKISTLGGHEVNNYLFITLEDVTDKKLEEDLLYKTQEVAKIGSWRMDLKSNTIFWSDMVKTIHEVPLDFKPDLEKAIFFYKAGRSREHITNLVSRAIASGTSWDTELIIVTEKGKEKWVRAIGEPEMVNGSCIRLVGTFQDINARKQTEMELERSKNAFADSIKNSKVGMALVSPSGQFLEANESLCALWGYNKEELKKLTFQEITHQEDLEKDLALLNEVINGKRNTYQLEKRYFDKKGQIVYALLTVTAVRDQEGTIQQFISQVIGLNERIKNENKLKKLLDITTNQNESLLNFAYIVSHNLRSHASNLALVCGLVNNNKLSASQREEAMLHLEKASSSLNETIDHLNDVVQIKIGGEQHLEKVDLKKTISNTLKGISALIAENKVAVTLDYQGTPNISGKLIYVESIVLNLISNAIKYRNTAIPAKITIRVQELNDAVLLEVEDNGLGIDMEANGRNLFGMYKTFHKHKDAKGIGLFITKSQVEAIGGKIAATSSVNQGSTFSVKFKKHQV